MVSARIPLDEISVNIAICSITKKRFFWLFPVLIIYNGINASNRSLFTGAGICYNADFSKSPKYIDNQLIGNLLLGYTAKNQQAELSIHFGLDFLNGIDRYNHSFTNTIIDTMPELSLIYTDHYKTINFKKVELQLSISSDIYFGSFFSRVQSQFYFEESSTYNSKKFTSMVLINL